MSTFAIDSENNIAFGAVPADAENLQSFASEEGGERVKNLGRHGEF